MEQYNDGGYGKPEQRMESPKSGPSSMKFQDVLLVGGSLPDLDNMDCVLQFIHVFMVSSYVEDRSHRLRQLHLDSYKA